MREDRWLNLVRGASRLEEQLEASAQEGALTPEERARRVGELLDNLLDVFPSGLDPVEDFEGYSVRRLAQALERALTPAERPLRCLAGEGAH